MFTHSWRLFEFKNFSFIYWGLKIIKKYLQDAYSDPNFSYRRKTKISGESSFFDCIFEMWRMRNNREIKYSKCRKWRWYPFWFSFINWGILKIIKNTHKMLIVIQTFPITIKRKYQGDPPSLTVCSECGEWKIIGK